MSQMGWEPQMHPKCILHIYLHLPWTYFVNQKVLNIPYKYCFACEYLKVLVSVSRVLFFRNFSVFAQALICCVKASYCPWRMCNRNGHCWNHKFLANGKIWKIAFLKLDAAVIFFTGLWKWKGTFMDLRVMYVYINNIYIYMYMHNTYQICIYILYIYIQW